MNRPTSRFKNPLILLVGVCLIASAFHVHQLLPNYPLHSYNLEHYLSVDQPDCIACLHLLNGLPTAPSDAAYLKHKAEYLVLLVVYSPHFEPVFDLNNKSPPYYIKSFGF